MDPGQARRSVGPELGPNCLQGLLADGTTGKELKSHVMEKTCLSAPETLIENLVVATNSFLASSNFCRQLITFTNSLDPDQNEQNVFQRSGSKLFDTLIAVLKEFFEKVNL